MTADRISARTAIESLRSGVPSRSAVQELGTTHHKVEESFRQALNALGDGRPANPITLSANFGAGKTHLLGCLRRVAESEGFVTSYVVVSPEMPLGNAHVVLKSVVENARAPGREGKALRELASDLRTNSPAFADLRLWARDANVDERFSALLHVFEAFQNDDELCLQILEDLEGKPLLKTVVKQKLKEIHELGSYTMKWPKNALVAHDRLRVMARFVRAANCKGLVVLFDELERIAKFPRRQRIASYRELAWWAEVSAMPGSAILPVFAWTQVFSSDVQADEQTVKVIPFREGEEDQREKALRGIKLVEAKPFVLSTPSPEEQAVIRYRVKQVYEVAYDTSVPDAPPADAVTTIRAEIRRWITHWDLYRYYPGHEPSIAAESVEHDTAEVSEVALAPDDEE